MDQRWKILMIDDDYEDYLVTKTILRDCEQNIQLDWVPDGEACRPALQQNAYDAVLVDYDLGADTGLDLIKTLDGKVADAPFILYTSRRKDDLNLEDGRVDYLDKNHLTTHLFERTIGYAIDRKKAEDALRLANENLEQRVQARTAELAAANALLEKVFATTQTGIAYLDRDFNFIRVNQTYASFDDRTPEDFPGRNHFALYPNEENEAIFHQVVETKVPYIATAKPFEYIRRPERGVTYWDWTLIPVEEPDGQVSGLVFTLVDVTAREKARLALKDRRVEFEVLFEASPDAILLVDLHGKILRANRRSTETFGYMPDELVGKRLELLIPERFRQNHAALLQEYFRQPTPRPLRMGANFFGLQKNGHEFPLDIALSPVELERETRIICTIRPV